MQSIVAATRTSAELCGVDDRLGTVEVGKLADAVVVRGNPLSDVDGLGTPENILMVVKDGVAVGNRGGFTI